MFEQACEYLEVDDRRADALRVFQRVRSTLDRELGIAPCRQLHELHQQILADEELRVPAAA